MLVKIGNTDLTPLINESSHDVERAESYKSWQDGNFKEHRKYTRSQVQGSFDIVLGPVRETTFEEFKSLLEANSSNHVLTLAVYVNNTAKVERIEAYYTLKVKTRHQLADGTYLETITVSIKEC